MAMHLHHESNKAILQGWKYERKQILLKWPFLLTNAASFFLLEKKVAIFCSNFSMLFCGMTFFYDLNDSSVVNKGRL